MRGSGQRRERRRWRWGRRTDGAVTRRACERLVWFGSRSARFVEVAALGRRLARFVEVTARRACGTGPSASLRGPFGLPDVLGRCGPARQLGPVGLKHASLFARIALRASAPQRRRRTRAARPTLLRASRFTSGFVQERDGERPAHGLPFRFRGLVIPAKAHWCPE